MSHILIAFEEVKDRLEPYLKDDHLTPLKKLKDNIASVNEVALFFDYSIELQLHERQVHITIDEYESNVLTAHKHKYTDEATGLLLKLFTPRRPIVEYDEPKILIINTHSFCSASTQSPFLKATIFGPNHHAFSNGFGFTEAEMALLIQEGCSTFAGA